MSEIKDSDIGDLQNEKYKERLRTSVCDLQSENKGKVDSDSCDLQNEKQKEERLICL